MERGEPDVKWPPGPTRGGAGHLERHIRAGARGPRVDLGGHIVARGVERTDAELAGYAATVGVELQDDDERVTNLNVVSL